MAVTSKRERALQVVLVVLGLATAGAALGVFLVLAARNPSAYRSFIAYAIWSSFAHTAVMALMAIQLPTRRGELLAGVVVTGLGAVLLFVLARFAARSEGAVPV
ncbi:MAG TPA: DUF6632 domain-containing protein [Burkholderiales bacterium]